MGMGISSTSWESHGSGNMALGNPNVRQKIIQDGYKWGCSCQFISSLACERADLLQGCQHPKKRIWFLPGKVKTQNFPHLVAVIVVYYVYYHPIKLHYYSYICYSTILSGLNYLVLTVCTCHNSPTPDGVQGAIDGIWPHICGRMVPAVSWTAGI